MGLTDQQKLYMLPNYFLIFNEENEIVGLLTQNQINGQTIKKLESEGYHTELVNFDALNMQGTRILEKLGIIGKKWMRADEFLEKYNEYKQGDI